MKNYITIRDEAKIKATLAIVQNYADLVTEKFIPLLNFDFSTWIFYGIFRRDSQVIVEAYGQYLNSINFDLTPIEKKNRIKLFIQNEVPRFEKVINNLKQTHSLLYAGSSLSSIKFFSGPYWLYDMIHFEDRVAVISEYAKEKITRFFTVRIERGSVQGFLRAQKKLDSLKIPVWPKEALTLSEDEDLPF